MNGVPAQGADRAGKSTQCERLQQHLATGGRRVELWRFPDRSTVIGNVINSYLKGTEKLGDQLVRVPRLAGFAALYSLTQCLADPPAFCLEPMGKAVRSPPQPGTAPGLACAQSFLPPAQRHACRGVPAAAPLCRRKLEEALNSGTTVVLDRYAYSGVAYTVAKGVPGLDLEWCKAPDKGLPAPDALIFLDVTEQQAAARGGYGSETYENVVFQRSVRSLPPRVMHAKVCTRTFARSGVVDGSRDVLRS